VSGAIARRSNPSSVEDSSSGEFGSRSVVFRRASLREPVAIVRVDEGFNLPTRRLNRLNTHRIVSSFIDGGRNTPSGMEQQYCRASKWLPILSCTKRHGRNSSRIIPYSPGVVLFRCG